VPIRTATRQLRSRLVVWINRSCKPPPDAGAGHFPNAHPHPALAPCFFHGDPLDFAGSPLRKYLQLIYLP
jgi:hypothetical protein